ncbi:MAG TPA: methyltransferase domain-containing protein [Patescibacteria group bacterium]|nr:methyltransferase domain-containing protein [Patescibacteria group bacterium]
MNQLPHRYVFILGSHPELSFAELEALLQQTFASEYRLEQSGSLAFVSTTTPIDAPTLMNHLGGTIKIAKLISEYTEDTLIDWLFEQIHTATKFHFGFSLYTLPGVSLKPHAELRKLHLLGLAIKRSLKQNSISCRFVASKELTLSSVIVHKERLLKNGVDIVLLKGIHNTEFGKTLAVQPFQAFSKRDYGRPNRDHHSGMLPPKVARMMVHIAQPKKESVILDPFCGSGTILQEALLLGYTHVIGSDISSKAVEDTKQNLAWLRLPSIHLYTEDAQHLVHHHKLALHSIDRIVFEGYLGEPRPNDQRIPFIIQHLNELYTNVFTELIPLLRMNGRIVAALPFWHTIKKEYHLNIQKMTQSAHVILQKKPLLYRRPQSTVGREIIIVEPAILEEKVPKIEKK